MSRPPKKHWMGMFEERIEELEGKISNLEQHVELMNRIIVDSSAIGVHISLISIMHSVELEALDTLMLLIKKVEENLERMGKPAYIVPVETCIDLVISNAKRSKIPFQKLAPYLIEKLDNRLAKRTVKKESILKHYGEGAFTIWEILLEKGS